MREELAEARQRRGVRQSSGALVLLRRHLWTTAGARQSHVPGQSGRGLPHSKTSRTSRGACELAPARTADFQSAVSRIPNPQGLGVFRRFRVCPRPCRLEVGDTAGWKPAAPTVPQTSSLLYRGFPIRKVWGFSEGFGFVQGPADWKSAIQQVGNLRHASRRK